jgi:hypothetical protein
MADHPRVLGLLAEDPVRACLPPEKLVRQIFVFAVSWREKPICEHVQIICNKLSRRHPLKVSRRQSLHPARDTGQRL